MEFELRYTAAQEAFRNEVRTWLAENVPDGITSRPRSFEASRAIYLMRRELGRKLGAKGWLYPSGEKTYGGGGLDLDQIIVLEEETARLGLGLPPYYDSGGKMGSASIRVWGTEEQKQRFLPPIYGGEVRPARRHRPSSRRREPRAATGGTASSPLTKSMDAPSAQQRIRGP